MIPIESTEDCIGIDDFAIKKGSKYCTIVCNGNSRTPIAILEGRDGVSLKEWLKNNKHIKCVTRDRAFGYSEIASETGVSTRTIARYRTGDPESMCHLGRPGRHKLPDSLKGSSKNVGDRQPETSVN